MQPSKCTNQLIEQIRLLIERGMPWSKAAKVVGVHKATLAKWKNPDSPEHNVEFAAMVEEAEEINSNKAKKGQMAQSVRHKLRVRELVTEGPKRPRADYTVEMLYWYADEVLDLDLAPGMDSGECLYHIDREINDQTVTKMVVVREQEVDPSQAAVKNVLTNTGDPNKRWKIQERHEIDGSEDVKKFMSWLTDRDGADDGSETS